MTLDQIRYFIRVAELQHLGNAARDLRISPSAISHAIGSIESEIGRNLFTRERKRLKLTEHGYYFLKNAKEILEKVETLKHSVSLDTVEFTGTIKIASISLIISTIIAPAWANVSKKFPFAKIEFIDSRSSRAIDLCFEGLVDLAICFKKFEIDQLNSRDIQSGKVYMCAKKNHPLTKLKGALQKRAISKFPVVIPRKTENADKVYDCDLLSIMGTQENVTTYSFDGFEVAHSLLANTFAWGAMPDWLIQHYNRDLVSLDKDNPLGQYRITAFSRKLQFSPKPVQELLNEIERMSLQKP